MSKLEEILSINEIKHLVNAFYGKVRRDELLGPIFNEQIGDMWPEAPRKDVPVLANNFAKRTQLLG